MERNEAGRRHQEVRGNHDPKLEKSRLFKITLGQILSQPLSPENIDRYAEDALTGLIGLVSSITAEYDKQQPFHLSVNKDLEDKAFSYFGLNNIEEILSNVSSKAEEIRRLDLVIAMAEKKSSVYLPPQQVREPILQGEGSFKDKSIKSRTKTLLFILSNDFEVDINDPEQLSLTTGVLMDNMMRKESYFMINVPKLNRTILSCDEEGNVTYLFDNAVLASYGISQKDLANLTKKEINDFLLEDSNLGKRIVYSNRFVPNMINLITNLNIEYEHDQSEDLGRYLYLKAPEGILSVNGLAKQLGVGEKAIRSAIERIPVDQLGEVNKFNFRNKVADGYNLKQLERIRQELERGGFLSEQALDGVLSVVGIAKKFGVSYKIVDEIVRELGDLIGETDTYKFRGKPANGYTTQQQELVKLELEKRGLLSQLAPEGILSAGGIAVRLKVSKSIIFKVLDELGETLGETNLYKFGRSSLTTGYSHEQQEMVRQEVEKKGFFLESAPEGVLSLSSISQLLGVEFKVIKRVVEELGDRLGRTNIYKFGSKLTIGFTPEQQEIIMQKLENNGLFSERAPEGVASISSFAKRIGVNYETINKVKEELKDRLGPIDKFKFGSFTTAGFTTEQQEMIIKALIDEGLFQPKAPEGVLSVIGIARQLGVGSGTINMILEMIRDKVGYVNRFRFGTVIAAGFTTEQQEIIIKALIDEGLFQPKAPEGVLSIKGFSKKLGVWSGTIAVVVRELGDKLGPIDKFKFGSFTTAGFTAEQQEIIIQEYNRKRAKNSN